MGYSRSRWSCKQTLAVILGCLTFHNERLFGNIGSGWRTQGPAVPAPMKPRKCLSMEILTSKSFWAIG